jgi:hypothetical protein
MKKPKALSKSTAIPKTAAKSLVKRFPHQKGKLKIAGIDVGKTTIRQYEFKDISTLSTVLRNYPKAKDVNVEENLIHLWRCIHGERKYHKENIKSVMMTVALLTELWRHFPDSSKWSKKIQKITDNHDLRYWILNRAEIIKISNKDDVVKLSVCETIDLIGYLLDYGYLFGYQQATAENLMMRENAPSKKYPNKVFDQYDILRRNYTQTQSVDKLIAKGFLPIDTDPDNFIRQARRRR